MKRYSRDKNLLTPRPVEQVEVSNKNVKLRTVLFILFIGIAIACFAVVLVLMLRLDAGWFAISANSTNANCGDEFVFSYYFSEDDDKYYRQAVQDEYTNACVYAFGVFCEYEQIGDANNLYYINTHPNEEIQVSALLYRTIKTFEDNGSRFLYYAPVYEVYNALFSQDSDEDATLCDIEKNAELREYINTLLPFIKDENHVRIELLDDFKIKLVVSEEYKSAFGENIPVYVDFAWTKNAFIIDYIADTMIASGYENGVISSYNGFARNLKEQVDTLNANVFDYAPSSSGNNVVKGVATMAYTQKRSMVMLKNYPISSDESGYYKYEDGSVRHPFISLENGKNVSAINSFTAYSQSKSCAEIVLDVLPVYLADELDLSKLAELKADGIFSLYCKDCKIVVNDENIIITPLEREDGTYVVERVA